MILADQKKGLLAVSFLLFLSSFIYLTHLYSSHSTSKVADSSYLTNEQTFFDVSNNEAMFDPNSCNCNTSPVTEELSEIAPKENPIDIPESLPAAPKELTQKINANLLQDRVLIVATANYGMRNHVYNWIESLRLTGEEKFLIFCLDQKLFDHLTLAGFGDRASLIPDIWFHQQVEADFKTYFSQEYRAITHSKTLVVQQLLYLDINVFFSDVDIVWLRPRLVEYVNTLLQIRPETHVLFQQEGLNQQEINSGFYLMRPTIEMKRLLAETIHIQDTVEGKTQQGSMNLALNNLNMDLRTTSVVLLDVLHFPNGFVYYNHDLPNKHGIKPFIVHANYLVSLLLYKPILYINTPFLIGWRGKEAKVKRK